MKFKYSWVNRDKYHIIPRERQVFQLSEKQKEQANKIYWEKGNIDYIFRPTEIGWVVKIRVQLTNEEIDITDYDTW